MIAFARGWLLSLVLLSCIPPIVLAGGVMSIIMAKMSGRGQVAYADAGNVVEQTVGAIRTVRHIYIYNLQVALTKSQILDSLFELILKVASFTGEKRAIEKYNSKLKIAYAATVQQGLASGIGLGLVIMIVFSSYGLAVWYGSKLIIEKGYNGGQVLNVIMAIMTGGM